VGAAAFPGEVTHRHTRVRITIYTRDQPPFTQKQTNELAQKDFVLLYTKKTSNYSFAKRLLGFSRNVADICRSDEVGQIRLSSVLLWK